MRGFWQNHRILIIGGFLYFLLHMAIQLSGTFDADLRNALLDEKDYVISARNLILTGDYAVWGGQPAFRTPGYTIILAALKIIGGGFFAHIQIFQFLLGFFSGLLLFPVSRRFISGWLAVVPTLLFWFYPTLIIYRYLVYAETLYLFIFALFLWSFLRPPNELNSKRVIAAGAILGTLILVRAEWLLIAIAIGGWQMWRKQTRIGLILLSATIVTISPWFIRNAIRYGRPVLTTMTGYNLWMGNNPQATGSGVVDDNPELELMRVIREVETAVPPRQDTERSQRYTAKAISYIIENPLATLAIIPAKAGFLWANETRIIDWAFYRGRIRISDTGSGVLHFLLKFLWPAFLIALFTLWIWVKPAPFTWLYIIPFVSTVTVAIFTGEDRYHLQFLPILFLAIIAAIQDFKHGMRNRIQVPRLALCLSGMAFIAWSSVHAQAFYDYMRDSFSNPPNTVQVSPQRKNPP